MKAGWGIPNNYGGENPNELIEIAVKAEALGFGSVWVREHLFHATYVAERLGDKPYYDALTILIAIGAATKTVRLGTSVLVLPWHDPARLGKMIATLDQLSGGRVDFGIGVAMTRDEFENLGVDFTTRGKRTDEVLGALQALWTEDIPEFSGEFYRYSGLQAELEAAAPVDGQPQERNAPAVRKLCDRQREGRIVGTVDDQRDMLERSRAHVSNVGHVRARGARRDRVADPRYGLGFRLADFNGLITAVDFLADVEVVQLDVRARTRCLAGEQTPQNARADNGESRLHPAFVRPAREGRGRA